MRGVGDVVLVVAAQVRAQTLEAGVVGVAVDEGGVPQPALDDHVEHGEHDGQVRAGLRLQHLVCRGSQVEVQRVDADDLGAAVAGVVDLAQAGRNGKRRLLSPEDEEVGVVVVAAGHAAVGHALHDGARHEALGGAHAHLGAHAMRQALGHVVGEAPAGRLPADEAHRPRPVLSHGLLDLAGQLSECVVPAHALPLALTALANTAHGVHEASWVVRDLRARLALAADGAAGARVARHAAHANDAVVLNLDVDGAAVMAAATNRAHDALGAALLTLRSKSPHRLAPFPRRWSLRVLW